MDRLTKPGGTWTEIVDRKRQIREAALQLYQIDDAHLRPERVDNVAERSRIEPQSAQDITDIDSIELLHQGIKERKFTAEEVILAYIKRSVNFNKIRGCFMTFSTNSEVRCAE